MTDAAGAITRFAYDDHRLVSHTDSTGLAARFVYDAQHRCIETWCEPADGAESLASSVPSQLADHVTKARGVLHCRIDYHPDGYSEVADSAQVQRLFGNAFGKLDKMVLGDGVTTRVYDDHGFELSHTDPLGAVTNWDRDDRGRVLRQVDPLGRVVTLTRDSAGRVVEVVDPAGGATRIFRDASGNVAMVRDPTGAVTSFKYNERVQVVEAVAPNGGRTRGDHDAHGNLVRLTEPNGAVWQASSRPRTNIDPRLRLTCCSTPRCSR